MLVILAIPVIMCLLVGVAEVVDVRAEASETRELTKLVRTAAGPTSLATSLIDERTINALERSSLQDDLTLRIGTAAEARQATDEQLDALQELVAGSRDARQFYQPVLDSLLAELEGIRADADATTEPADVDARYTSLVTDLIGANAATVDLIEDSEFRQGARLSELATRQKETRAKLIDAMIPPGLETRTLTSPEVVSISALLSEYERAHTTIGDMATGRYNAAGDILFEAIEVADLAEFTHGALSTGQVDARMLYDLASYKSGFVYQLPSGDFIHDSFRNEVVALLNAEAEKRSNTAADRFRFYLMVAGIGVVGASIITWLVAHSITRPMQLLTRQASEVTDHRLPTAVRTILERPLGEDVVLPQVASVEVTTRDEVADVANALNTMQQSALGLAVDQALLLRNTADSLANLGRRNQELLRRQIEFITMLEQNETDADALANFFHLDHLATRMRHNAESLLLLAGVDLPGTQARDAPILDLVRAAIGGTEEYQRVRIQRVEPVTVVGFATLPLSHLLAELIEHALTFSPSNQPVTIDGAGQPTGYVLTVRDYGADLDPEEIAQANRRFAGAESYTVAPSKYLAHYIVGGLALRHNIDVRLHRATGTDSGTTVTIQMPGNLLLPPGPASTPPTPQVPPRDAFVPEQPPDDHSGPIYAEPSATEPTEAVRPPPDGTFVIPINPPSVAVDPSNGRG